MEKSLWIRFSSDFDFPSSVWLNKDLYTDVTLLCEDGSHAARAHKILLVSESDYFKEELAVGNVDVITLPNIKKLDLLYVLEFIYRRTLRIEALYLDKFLALTAELGIKGLRNLKYEYEYECDPDQSNVEGNTSHVQDVETKMSMEKESNESLQSSAHYDDSGLESFSGDISLLNLDEIVETLIKPLEKAELESGKDENASTKASIEDTSSPSVAFNSSDCSTALSIEGDDEHDCVKVEEIKNGLVAEAEAFVNLTRFENTNMKKIDAVQEALTNGENSSKVNDLKLYKDVQTELQFEGEINKTDNDSNFNVQKDVHNHCEDNFDASKTAKEKKSCNDDNQQQFVGEIIKADNDSNLGDRNEPNGSNLAERSGEVYENRMAVNENCVETNEKKLRQNGNLTTNCKKRNETQNVITVKKNEPSANSDNLYAKKSKPNAKAKDIKAIKSGGNANECDTKARIVRNSASPTVNENDIATNEKQLKSFDNKLKILQVTPHIAKDVHKHCEDNFYASETAPKLRENDAKLKESCKNDNFKTKEENIFVTRKSPSGNNNNFTDKPENCQKSNVDMWSATDLSVGGQSIKTDKDTAKEELRCNIGKENGLQDNSIQIKQATSRASKRKLSETCKSAKKLKLEIARSRRQTFNSKSGTGEANPERNLFFCLERQCLVSESQAIQNALIFKKKRGRPPSNKNKLLKSIMAKTSLIPIKLRSDVSRDKKIRQIVQVILDRIDSKPIRSDSKSDYAKTLKLLQIERPLKEPRLSEHELDATRPESSGHKERKEPPDAVEIKQPDTATTEQLEFDNLGQPQSDKSQKVERGKTIKIDFSLHRQFFPRSVGRISVELPGRKIWNLPKLLTDQTWILQRISTNVSTTSLPTNKSGEEMLVNNSILRDLVDLSHHMKRTIISQLKFKTRSFPIIASFQMSSHIFVAVQVPEDEQTSELVELE